MVLPTVLSLVAFVLNGLQVDISSSRFPLNIADALVGTFSGNLLLAGILKSLRRLKPLKSARYNLTVSVRRRAQLPPSLTQN